MLKITKYTPPIYSPERSKSGLPQHFLNIWQLCLGLWHLSYWERLSAINLISLHRRRERYIIIRTWKIIKGSVSNDLLIKFATNKRHDILVIVQALKKSSSTKAKTYYDNSFHVKAAQLCNILPKETKSSGSLEIFKASLPTFLKNIPDRLHVIGYTTARHNSLLDWFP